VLHERIVVCVHNLTVVPRQSLIQRAAQLDYNDDAKLAGLADTYANGALELARMTGVAAVEQACWVIRRGAIDRLLAAGDGAHGRQYWGVARTTGCSVQPDRRAANRADAGQLGTRSRSSPEARPRQIAAASAQASASSMPLPELGTGKVAELAGKAAEAIANAAGEALPWAARMAPRVGVRREQPGRFSSCRPIQAATRLTSGTTCA
jgi:hypothetical protein